MKNETQNEIKVKGFKAMDPDMKCRGFQFEVGKTFRHHGRVIPCYSGFHFCKDIDDIKKYYGIDCRIFEVEASGTITQHYDKTVTDTLTIVREIDYADYVDHDSIWLKMVIVRKKIHLDKLVHSKSNEIRHEVAKQGYGLDILVNDPCALVRKIVAQHGLWLDKLINDNCQAVRAEVAKQGYGLDVLLHDHSTLVRSCVARRGYGLDVLINDNKWQVSSIARTKMKELKNAK